MKLKLRFLLFFLFYSVNSSKLSQSACEIVSEVHKKENWMKTIAVVNFNKNFDDEVLENLLMCLPMEISMTFMNTLKKKDFGDAIIHKPELVVAFIDRLDFLDPLFKMTFDYRRSPILNHNSKFLILTTRKDEKFLEDLKFNLDALSIVNYAIIFDDSDKVTITTCEEAPHVIASIDSQFIDKIYPSNSKCIKNQTLNIFIHHQVPRVQLENGKVHSRQTHFLDAVAKVDRLEFHYLNHSALEGNDHKLIIQNLNKFYQNRDMELTLNTLIEPVDAAPRLMTYEETGQCLLIRKSRKPSMAWIFLKPFDILTWTFIIVSVVSCMIIWRLGSHSTSMWYIPFFFWAFYHGQSVNFATNRKIFVILLQILVFMLFILGNAYQGIITSSMIEGVESNRLESFDEVLNSDLKIIAGTYVHNRMMKNSKYQKAFEDGRVEIKATNLNPSEINDENVAVVASCESLKHGLETGAIKNFYLVEENLFSNYVRLQVIFNSKYLRRLQLLMDWSFENGLNKAWENFERDGREFKEVEESQREILNLEDVTVGIYALVVGLVVSGLGFVCEILWNKLENKRRVNIE